MTPKMDSDTASKQCVDILGGNRPGLPRSCFSAFPLASEFLNDRSQRRNALNVINFEVDHQKSKDTRQLALLDRCQRSISADTRNYKSLLPISNWHFSLSNIKFDPPLHDSNGHSITQSHFPSFPSFLPTSLDNR